MWSLARGYEKICGLAYCKVGPFEEKEAYYPVGTQDGLVCFIIGTIMDAISWTDVASGENDGHDLFGGGGRQDVSVRLCAANMFRFFEKAGDPAIDKLAEVRVY